MYKKYKRILLKLSGEALSDKKNIFNKKILINLVNQIKKIKDLGIEIAIVVGGGNFIRGRMSKKINIARTQVDYMGMLGTIINALAIQGIFERYKISSCIQTAIRMDDIAEPLIIKKAKKNLKNKKIIIFAAGVGSPFFSTDTTAALRAAEIKAEIIFMAKNNVDGVYDVDPIINKKAKKYKKISYKDFLNKKLKIVDPTAIHICEENNIKILVFNINKNNNILNVLKGKGEFTYIV